MRIIEPRQPSPATLTNSSIPEDSTPLWDQATSYAVDDEVRRFAQGAYRIYRCVVANTGEDPALQTKNLDGSLYWINVRSANRWAMFDESVNSPSTDTADISVEYTPGRAINSIAVLNVTGGTVSVSATSALAGGVFYSESYDAFGTRGPGWYEYFFGEVQQATRFTFFNIPPYPDAVFTVTITTASGIAEVGELIFGNQFYIGQDEIGMSPELKSYSTAEFDETFGYVRKVNRLTRRRLRTRVAIESSRADVVFRKMQQLDNVNLVWLADKYESGIIYGFYSQFSPVAETHPLVFATIRIEGLT